VQLYPHYLEEKSPEDQQADEDGGLCEGNDEGLTTRMMIETGNLCSLFTVRRYRTEDEKAEGQGYRV
jgi:hypothetical protein